MNIRNNLPIYDFYKKNANNKIEFANGNVGLAYERFFDGYKILEKEPIAYRNEQTEISKHDDAKKEFLNKIAKNDFSNHLLLKQVIAKQIKLVTSLQGDTKVFELNGSFATGLGNSHPVENGFTWHYTLGVPYIPGSQVKGVMRSLIEIYAKEKDDKHKEIKNSILLKWFGSVDKNEENSEKRIGELIFFDALPVDNIKLKVDVTTPHMGEWYVHGNKIQNNIFPSDLHQPVPIPFLVVEQASFRFSIGLRAGSDIDMSKVFSYLEKALNYVGAGAKTQLGYGSMTRVKNDK